MGNIIVASMFPVQSESHRGGASEPNSDCTIAVYANSFFSSRKNAHSIASKGANARVGVTAKRQAWRI